MTEEIRKYDKDFTEATFYTKVDHIFIMILSAIMEGDISTVKHYLKEDIYNKYKEMVDNYNKKGITRLFDEMNVKSTRIVESNVSDNTLHIVVALTSRYMDYFIDDNGKYITGINDHRIEKEHRLVFSKRLNTKELGEIRRCPSCGHGLDINATGLCPYCNNTIDMSNYDYILTEIDEI